MVSESGGERGHDSSGALARRLGRAGDSERGHSTETGFTSGRPAQGPVGEPYGRFTEKPEMCYTGGVSEKCNFDTCDRVEYSGGLCAAHDAQKRRNTPLRPVGDYRVQDTPTICQVELCGNKMHTRGLCWGHYVKGRTATVEQVPLSRCLESGCQNWATHTGRCAPHQRKLIPFKPCTFPGCDRPYESKGYCKSHAAQHRSGKPLKELRPWGKYTQGNSDTCFVPNCTSLSKSGCYGGCKKHASWARHRVPPEVANSWFANPRCEACGAANRLSVDHNHQCCPGSNSCGKCVRGLLCSSCNSTLGHANDDPSRLQSLISYLASK